MKALDECQPIVLTLQPSDAWIVMEHLALAAAIPANDGPAAADALLIAHTIADGFSQEDAELGLAARRCSLSLSLSLDEEPQ